MSLKAIFSHREKTHEIYSKTAENSTITEIIELITDL